MAGKKKDTDIIIEDSGVLYDETENLQNQTEGTELLSEEQDNEKPQSSEKEIQSENKAVDNSVLKIVRKDELVSEQDLIRTTLHELTNSRITGTILTGTISGIERINKDIIAVVYYKSIKVIIPLQEMELPINQDTPDYSVWATRLLQAMVFAEIDFIVRKVDEESEIAIASRKLAMKRKRRNFYYPIENNSPLIEPGRQVQARVIAVREKNMLIEAFGAQYQLLANETDYNFVSDLRKNYSVGDKTVVRISEIKFEDDNGIEIKADIKSTKKDTSLQKLLSLNLRSSYLGTITDIYYGTIYIVLASGVNAVAHTCLDVKSPSKGDQVAFVVNQLNRENRLALGIVTKIVRQNLN